MPRSCVDAALRYAERGIPIFPVWGVTKGRCDCGRADCRNPGKHPLTTLVANGVTDAVTDPEQIRRWWAAYPNANVGGAMGDLIAVDEDLPGSLVALGVEVPNCPVQRTGKGQHYIFKANGTPLKNRWKFAPGLDARASGGYIVLAPSAHIAGHAYAWVPGHSLEDLDPPEIPSELARLIAAAPNGAAGEHRTDQDLFGRLDVEALLERLEGMPQQRSDGGWREPMLRVVASLVARGLPDRLILTICRRATWKQAGYTHADTDKWVRREIRYARKRWDVPEPDEDGDSFNKIDGEPTPKADLSKLCLTPEDWSVREISSQDLLLGSIFSTTTRTQLIADTGLGKTMTGLGASFAIRLGRDFLGWSGHREARVLYIDGEMPAELIKERLELAHSWFQVIEPISDRFWLLSREDLENMPPLDRPEAKDWLLDLIGQLGGVDHTTFDNIGALTGDCLKEEDGARVLKELQRELTKRKVGQLWLHHTGHDNTRGYGSKMREWHLDTVMVAERLEAIDADVSITLKFPKSRRRTPTNRSDYGPFEVVLRNGDWSVTRVTDGKKSHGLGKRARLCLDALRKALDEIGTLPPYCSATAGVRLVVTLEQWRQFFDRIAPYGDDDGGAARRMAWKNGTEELTSSHVVGKWDRWVWITQKAQA